MIGLLGAIQFLTRIPIRLRQAVEHARTVAWFPIVGVLLGLAIGGAAAGLRELLPAFLTAACAVVIGLLLTGAFHEDGLADIADAFGGGVTRDSRFEILSDPRHGTYGVAALIASIVLRIVAAGSVPTGAALFAGLLAAHVLGRAAAVAAMTVLPTATPDGLGASHADGLRRGRAWLGIVVALGVVVLVTGWWAAPLALAALVGTTATAWLAMRKIGGLVGDVLGAIEQVVECLVLVVVAGIASRHQLWWH